MKTTPIIFAFLLISTTLFSQNSKKFKRRTYANQFYDLTDKGTLQTENFLFFENNQADNYNIYLPDLRIRYGLHEDLELFADIDALYNNNQKYGIVPISFGFKVNVMEEKKYFPDIALVTALQLGNIGTKNYKLSKNLPLLGFIANKNLSKKLNIEFDYFMQWIDDDTYQTEIIDINLIYQLNEKISLSSGINYFSDEQTNNNYLIDFGFTYQNKSTAYSMEYGHKLQSENLNYFIGIGITKNIKLK